MTPTDLSDDGLELYERVERLFDLRVSSSGADITIRLGGESMTVPYEAFTELRKSIEELVSQYCRSQEGRILQNAAELTARTNQADTSSEVAK